MTAPDMCGAEFTGPSWATWRVVARLYDGDAHLLSADELALAKSLTGRTTFSRDRPREIYIGAGRRSGKTRFVALLAVHAIAKDYEALPVGGFAVAAIVAPDRRQSQLAFSYARGLVMASPLLREELVRETTDRLEFAHNTHLEIHTGNFRAVRGFENCIGICDEAAYLVDSEGRSNDAELVRALGPALERLGGSLVLISSPHRRRGVMFEAYEKYHGNDAADCLYLQAASTTLNPTLNQANIDRRIASDPEGGASEWLGLFRNDSSEYLPDALIDASIVADRIELPFQSSRRYAAWFDGSGGISDSACIALAHVEPGTRDLVVVLDQLHEAKAPHEPAEVVKRFAAILQRFGVNAVTGDRYSARWVVDAFRGCGIAYLASELDRSAIYGECTRLFAEKRIELLDRKDLIQQLRQLERKPRAGGRPDSIDHGPRAHDDLINAAAGALWLASTRPAQPDEFTSNVSHALTNYDPLNRDAPAAHRPRHLPPGFAGGVYEEDFRASSLEYDPLSRD